MKAILFTLLSLHLLMMGSGCTVNEDSIKDRYPNLVEITAPGDLPYSEVSIGIEKADIVTLSNDLALHIKGYFPNPCTQLLRVEESFNEGVLRLELIGWQQSDIFCAQTITPFSYLYTTLNDDQLQSLEVVTVNGEEFTLIHPEEN